MPRLNRREIEEAFNEAMDPAVEDMIEDERREAAQCESWEAAEFVKSQLAEYLRSQLTSYFSIISFLNDMGQELFQYDESRELLVDRAKHYCYAELERIFPEHRYDTGFSARNMGILHPPIGRLTKAYEYEDILSRISALKPVADLGREWLFA